MARLYRVQPRVMPPGGFSSSSAPSTELYNPDPASFLVDPPSTWLDSSYARDKQVGSTAITFASTVTLTDSGNTTTNTTNLQSEIDAASTRVGHSKIRLPNGFVANRIRLRKHTQGAYWTYIEWTGIDAQITEGTQANHTTTGTKYANAPIIQSASNSPTGAVWCDLGADYTRFTGIHFRATVGSPCYRLLYFQGTVDDNSAEADDTSVSDTPRWMIVDRCWIEGGNTSRVVNGIVANCRELCVVDSVIDGIYYVGIENHGIVGYNGPGPWKIVGNTIEAASISFLIGGADPRIVGLQTNDLEIRRNYFVKRESWNPRNVGVFDGVTGKVVKNLFEFKWGNRALVEGNVFYGSPYGDDQKGAFLVWKVENSGGGNATATTANVTYRYNYATNVVAGYEFQGIGFGGTVNVPLHRVHHLHNAVLLLGSDRQNAAGGGGTRAFFFNNGANEITVDHDTLCLATTEATTMFRQTIQFAGAMVCPNITIKDSILGVPIASPPYDADERAICGDGNLTVSPDTGTRTLEVYTNNQYVFEDNVMVRSYSAQVNPPASQYLTAISGVGFVDIANLNCRLTNVSAYKGICNDGTDPGCNLDLVLAATAGVAH